MKFIIKSAAAIAFAAFAASTFAADDAAADPAKGKGKGDRFTLLDKNKDGKVSLEEYTAVMEKSKKEPKPTAEEIDASFKKLDKDKSGDLSKEELTPKDKGAK